MKKFIILALLAVFLGSGAQLFAKDSDYYAKTVFVSKVTAHQKGYQVIYMSGNYTFHTVYLPIEWFSQVGNFKNDDGFTKAEFVYGVGPAYPFLQIYWKDGKFHHVRLFVNQNYNDPSWGVLGDREDIGKNFDPAGSLTFKF